MGFAFYSNPDKNVVCTDRFIDLFDIYKPSWDIAGKHSMVRREEARISNISMGSNSELCFSH